MPDPLSLTALYLGFAGLAVYARGTSAVSLEAGQVGAAALDVLNRRERSESLFGRKALALSRLHVAVAEAIPDDSQEPVTGETLFNAEQFLRALPDDLEAPHFGVEPDGAIAFDWNLSRTQMFSVSVSASDKLAYAWLDGAERGHGVATFRDPALSQHFLTLLRSYADAAPALRAA